LRAFAWCQWRKGFAPVFFNLKWERTFYGVRSVKTLLDGRGSLGILMFRGFRDENEAA
jgi:hypothetical protein